MKPFIFDARNGIHIIDLSKTLAQLEAATNFLAATVRKGGKVVFVGTKKQAQQCVKDTAKECGQFYVCLLYTSCGRLAKSSTFTPRSCSSGATNCSFHLAMNLS